MRIPSFVLLLLVPTFGLTCTLLGQSALAIREGITGGQFGEPISQPLAVAWDGLLDFRGEDFDRDGAMDLLFADRRGIWLCWGRPGASVGSAELVLDAPDAIDQMAFEASDEGSGYPSLLWVKMDAGNGVYRLSSYLFEGRELIHFRDIDPLLVGAIWCTGQGLLMGEDVSGRLLMEQQGVLVRLGEINGHVEELDFIDLNGDGLKDAVAEVNDQIQVALGLSTGGLGAWTAFTEDPVRSWDVAVNAAGERGLLANFKGREGAAMWIHRGGGWHVEEFDLLPQGPIIHHHSTQYDGFVLGFRQPVNTLYLQSLGSTMDPMGFIALAETESGEFVRVMDWDGDGDDDVVVLEEADRELTWIPFFGSPRSAEPRWGRTVLQLVADTCTAGFQLPLKVNKKWLRDGTWDDGFREWMLAEGGAWGLGDSGTVLRFPMPREAQVLSGPSGGDADVDLCLIINYLNYRVGEGNCLPIAPEREWHRVTYSRGSLGETTVAVDGVLCFDGHSDVRRFDHRALRLGAGFVSKWYGFARSDIESVGVYSGALTKEELLSFHATGATTLEPAVLLDFDGDRPLNNPFGGTELQLEGGAELVATPEGRGVRFDGRSGRARIMADIPEREVVLDLKFKGTHASPPGVLASLYGMYNCDFSLVFGQPVSGIGGERSLLKEEHHADSLGGHLLTWGGEVRRMLPTGAWMEHAGGAWEPMVSHTLPRDKAAFAPWVQEGKVHAVFGTNGEVWTCQHVEAGWEPFGTLVKGLRDMEGAVSTGHWAFVWGGDFEWIGWLDVQHARFYNQSTAVIPPEVSAVRAGQGGVELMDGKGRWWLVPPPEEQHAHSAAFVKPSTAWAWGGVCVFAASLLAWGLWARARGRGRKGEAAAGELGTGLAHILACLQEHAGRQVEVLELDAILGLSDIDTDETRRSRRNRAINEVNAWSIEHFGESWVNRTRDARDRRRAMYQLSRDLAEWKRSGDATKEGA